jgi:hypothetical protein
MIKMHFIVTKRVNKIVLVFLSRGRGVYSCERVDLVGVGYATRMVGMRRTLPTRENGRRYKYLIPWLNRETSHFAGVVFFLRYSSHASRADADPINYCRRAINNSARTRKRSNTYLQSRGLSRVRNLRSSALGIMPFSTQFMANVVLVRDAHLANSRRAVNLWIMLLRRFMMRPSVCACVRVQKFSLCEFIISVALGARSIAGKRDFLINPFAEVPHTADTKAFAARGSKNIRHRKRAGL